MSDTPKVFVIIVTYNGSKWVNQCFSSLIRSSIECSIFAVDNGSTDDTVQLIRDGFPSVNVIETNRNLGFGKANNIGLKIAIEQNADYVFLLNQDAWVTNNTIETLVKISGQYEFFGVLSPFHLLPNQQKLEWHFSTYISPERCKNLVSDIYFATMKDVYELDFVNAAAWLLPRKCILEIGGFDPLFPHYGEDDDFCNRVIYKGLKVGIVPDAIIYHDITMKTWDEIKFNPQRQLIFSFIELKNVRQSYHFLLFNHYKNWIGKLISLIVLRKWREFKLMAITGFRSFGYLRQIGVSRKKSKQHCSYLK